MADESGWVDSFMAEVERQFAKQELEEHSAETIQKEYEEGLTDLLLFIQAYSPIYEKVPDERYLNRIVSIMATNIHAQFPDENVLFLFAKLCEALIAYGSVLKEGNDTNDH